MVNFFFNEIIKRGLDLDLKLFARRQCCVERASFNLRDSGQRHRSVRREQNFLIFSAVDVTEVRKWRSLVGRQIVIDMHHAFVAALSCHQLGNLPRVHSDPFDRLLIAQSLVDDIPIVSVDEAFDSYGVTRIW